MCPSNRDGCKNSPTILFVSFALTENPTNWYFLPLTQFLLDMYVFNITLLYIHSIYEVILISVLFFSSFKQQICMIP